MEEETLQQSADRLKNFQGNVKGEVFRTHAEYIRQKEGEEGIKKVEKRMEEIGAPLAINKVESFGWISEGMSSLTILTAKEVFSWTDEDVFQMGRFAPRFSFIIKVMIRYLSSLETLIKNIENYWNKHYDFGSLELVEINETEKRAVIREKGVDTHPTICIYHAGYFKGICEFVLTSKNITIEETSCVHEGSEYNEFLITWD